MFPKPVLERYRQEVDDATTGTALVKALQGLERGSHRIFEEPAYKRVPQGYAKDHPRAELLRYAGIGAGTAVPTAALTSAELVGLCAGLASKLRPLLDWLAALDR
jgi:uncharacterized protein (DUF2461 family)